MKNNFVLSETSVRLFNLTLNQMDQAISEMRRVAHNMMPESLIAFGLPRALEQMCASLSENGTNILFESINMDERMQKDKEINAYRIVQELVNNAMKHAKAAEIIVQISRNDGDVNLVVEDNGTGLLSGKEGSGFTNLRNRVNYLKGTMDINSESGKGTSILITFPFK
jgi:signal transduction histidine kinase